MEPLSRPRGVFHSAVQASVTLGAAVQQSFGPNGLDVLLETSDGRVSCCNCGRHILASLSLSHPVAGIISKAVTKHHQNFGDGSKKMLLVVEGAMKELGSLVMERQYSRPEVSGAMSWLSQSVLPLITDRLRKNKTVCKEAKTTTILRRILSQVASTSFRHHYGREISKMLEDILSSLLFPSTIITQCDIGSIRKRVSFTRKNMSTLVVTVAGQATSHSRTIPGLLLEGDLIHPSMRGGMEGCVGRPLCTLLLLEWSEEDDCHSPRFSLNLLSRLDDVMEKFSRQVQLVAHQLQANNIQLLLCCGKVPSVVRSVLRETGIAAVEMVPEDLLLVLAECYSTYPLPSVLDIMHEPPATVELSLSLLQEGPKQYICLHIPPDVGPSPVSVLLSGPTVGFCHQLEQQLASSLLLLDTTCREDPPTALVGGGAWEMVVIRELEIYKKTNNITSHSPKWTAIAALQKGLLTVPHSLLTSSLPPSSHPSHPALLTLHTSTATSANLPYMRVDCINGDLVEVGADWPVLEPFSLHEVSPAPLLSVTSESTG